MEDLELKEIVFIIKYKSCNISFYKISPFYDTLIYYIKDFNIKEYKIYAVCLEEGEIIKL